MTYRSSRGKTKVKIIVLSVIAVGVTLVGLCLILHLYKRKKEESSKQKLNKRLGNYLYYTDIKFAHSGQWISLIL